MPKLLDQPPLFRQLPILFIDLEMTGLDASQHEIVEIAALRVDQPNFNITGSYYAKVIPEHIDSADPDALRIISYSPESWSGAIPLRQAMIELSNFAPNCILAGWSIQNDWDFLNAALVKLNLPYFYSHRLLEIFSLAFAKLYHNQEVVHLNLANAAKVLGIHLERHKPDSDIRATYEIFKKLSDL